MVNRLVGALPKTSEEPNIYKATMDILEGAYYLSRVEDKPLTLDATREDCPLPS